MTTDAQGGGETPTGRQGVSRRIMILAASVLALVLLGIAFALASVSERSDDDAMVNGATTTPVVPSGGTRGIPRGSTPAPEAAVAVAKPPANPACTLLTPGQMEALVGAAVTKFSATNDGDQSGDMNSCTMETSGQGSATIVLVCGSLAGSYYLGLSNGAKALPDSAPSAFSVNGKGARIFAMSVRSGCVIELLGAPGPPLNRALKQAYDKNAS